MTQRGVKGIQTKTAMRACQLAESLLKEGVPSLITLYPLTEEEYERCKKAWESFKEEEKESRKKLVYKNVTVMFPSN